MSKRKAVKIPEEVTRSTETPAQKSKTMGVSLAREIISDQKKEIEQLKKKLAEVQEEARDWEKNWSACDNSLTASKRQLYIISMVLDLEDKQLLNMAFGFVNGCFKRQLEKEQEGEMDKKKEIIEMIEKCDNAHWIDVIYVFVKRLLK